MPYLLKMATYSKYFSRKLISRAKKASFPFFDGVPVYNVSVFFWRSIVNGSLTTRASSIAFNFFIALFPTIIFLFTLIPYIPIPNFQDELFFMIKSVVPASTFEAIEGTVEDIITKPRGGLLSLGFFMALIFSSNGITSMMAAFDASVHTIHRRSWISKLLISISLMFILGTLLTLAIGLIAGGQALLDYLVEHTVLFDKFTYYFLSAGKWVVLVAMFFFAYSFLYFLAPARKSKWRFISAGGTLATLLSIITLAILTFYINNFSQYNKLYGSIGTLLIILLLIYFLSLILLIGFELNASIYQAHQQNREGGSLFSHLREQVINSQRGKNTPHNQEDTVL